MIALHNLERDTTDLHRRPPPMRSNTKELKIY